MSFEEGVNIIIFNDLLSRHQCRWKGVESIVCVKIFKYQEEVVVCLDLLFCQNCVFVNVKLSN